MPSVTERIHAILAWLLCLAILGALTQECTRLQESERYVLALKAEARQACLTTCHGSYSYADDRCLCISAPAAPLPLVEAQPSPQ